MQDAFTLFQELLRADEPNYRAFLHELKKLQQGLSSEERARSDVLFRFCKALEGLTEQRTGTSDISVLLRQAIRTYRQRLVIKRSLWQVLSSREEATGLRLVGKDGANSVVLTADDWSPQWIPYAKEIDSLQSYRQDQPVAGDGLLYAMTQGAYTMYQSEAQKAAVQASLFLPPGATLLVTLPTGGGKSLCIQLPAWQESKGGSIKGGTTLVVVPTVSLASDQERQALSYFSRPAGPEYRPSSYIGSTPEITKTTIRNSILNGTLPILYTAPESLHLSSSLYHTCLEAARRGTLKRLVIDEAHLVETWGAGFRTAFQFLSVYQKQLLAASQHKLRTLLLSATVSPDCEQLLSRLFGANNACYQVRADRLRPEISYWFDYCDTAADRKAHVIEALRHLPRPAILYVASPKDADRWFNELKRQGFERVATYSGDTEDSEKVRLVDAWNDDRLDIMVATSAFGMGVDKRNVRTVIHAYLPENIHRFYQEVGRVGRDGYSAISLCCVAKGDNHTANYMVGPSRIKTETAMPRWEGMWRTRQLDREHGDLILLDTNAPPTHNPEMYQGTLNQGWNEHTLLLMQRAGLIEVVDIPRESNIVAPKRAETPAINAEIPPSWLQVRLMDPLITASSQGTELRALFEQVRNQETTRIKQALSKMKKMMHSYATATATECLALRLAEAYPKSTTACGGCPSCRQSQKAAYLYPLPLDFAVQFNSSPPTIVKKEFADDMGSRKRIHVTLDKPPPRALLQQLLGGLVGIGFSQLILPTPLLTDVSWVKDLLKELAVQARLHTIFSDTWVTHQEERPLLTAPTVAVYPLQDNEADLFHRAFRQREAKQLQGVPLVAVVHQELFLKSEGGAYRDKINGLDYTVEDLLARLKQHQEQGLTF